jgi:hypothetical protein
MEQIPLGEIEPRPPRVLPTAIRESHTHKTLISPSQLSNNQALHPNQINKLLKIHNSTTSTKTSKTRNQIYN